MRRLPFLLMFRLRLDGGAVVHDVVTASRARGARRVRSIPAGYSAR